MGIYLMPLKSDLRELFLPCFLLQAITLQAARKNADEQLADEGPAAELLSDL